MAEEVSFKDNENTIGETTQTHSSGNLQLSTTSPDSWGKSQVTVPVKDVALAHKLDSRTVQVDGGEGPLKSLPEDERKTLERQLDIQSVEVTFATVRIS